MQEQFPITVLISGGGTTLRNLIEKKQAGMLPVEFRLVISSNPSARGLDFARQFNIPTKVIPPDSYSTTDEYSCAVFQSIRESGSSLAVMGGFLKHVLVPRDFEGRIVNIHPALIPSFCGKGFYGRRVHEAVLEYGVKVSGCTVHFVDNQYDHGPIILQRTVPVLDDDTAESLASRVFEQECDALPEAIRLIAEGRVTLNGRHVRIQPP